MFNHNGRSIFVSTKNKDHRDSFKHKQIQIPTQLEKRGFFVVTMENMMTQLQLSDI